MSIITRLVKSQLLALSLLTLSSGAYAQTLAFPGAKGFGRYATGARASGTRSVYIVTNLNDSGTGSFRDAVSQPGRIVVFRVGGIVTLASDIVVAANTTIAGQTAPGTGIVLFNKRVTFSASNNTICRYLRVRLGATSNSGKDASGIANGANMIFDHCSFTWGMDEVFSINWDSKGNNPDNITIQNTILGQGLHRENHSAGGLIQPSTGGKISLIGNLYTSNKTRNPKVKGINEFVNNVVYNWGNANRLGTTMNYGWSGDAYIMGGDSAGDSFVNIINNYFIGGPSTNPSTSSPFTRGNANFNVYGSGNYFDNDQDGVLDGSLVPYNTTGYPTDDAAALKTTAYDYPEKAPTLTAAQAYQSVIDNVGANFPTRDQVDALMISDLQSKGTSGIYVYRETDLPLSNGGLGTFTAGTAPTDSDNDGIPNAWETANGLNPNSAADAVATSSSNPGYLNIEVYVNSLVTAPAQSVANSATWALTADQSAASTGSDITTFAQTFASGMTANYAAYSPGSGLYSGQTVSAQRLKPSAGWPANQTGNVATQYADYKVAPVSGKHFLVKTISLDFGDAGSTSTMKANVYYSLNGFSTAGTLLNPSPLTLPKYSATELFTNVTFSNLSIDIPSGSTLTVRVYPWWPSAASTTKYLVQRNVVISGKAAPTGVVISSVPQSKERLALNISEEQSLQVFPNPVGNRLTITFPKTSAASKVVILNVSGVKVLEQTIPAGSTETVQDVSSLPSGNYFLVHENGTSGQTKQFIKY